MKENEKNIGKVNCPLPQENQSRITLAHGGGGRLMNQVIEELFISTFDNDILQTRHDSAVMDISSGRLAFTTDSYVIDPLFFPGGDIGGLAINGTVNDLAMSGARPLYISTGFIIEEGFSIELLKKIVLSMKQAADRAEVKIVTGDTKVVDKGHGHGIFINTSGIGIIEHQLTIAPKSIRPGDRVIVNRDIGRHGVAVMSVRQGLSFTTAIESDCAPLANTVYQLISRGVPIHCLRDLTRGGLAAALTELAKTSGNHFLVEESSLPVATAVKSACEMLGLDPLLVANEGAMVLFVPESDGPETVSLLKNDLGWPNAAEIGRVTDETDCLVTIKTILGVERIVIMPSGEQLPRIC